jgi:filamentous hemagglutinin family protein
MPTNLADFASFKNCQHSNPSSFAIGSFPMLEKMSFTFLSPLVTGSILGSLLGGISPTLAQMVPDRTLGRESSVVTPDVLTERGLTNRIDGGAIRGSNLFHSFSEFNVKRGQQVHFADPAGIANIITRVTGVTLSNIDGTLGVLGNANLFLINPNGIVFGPNARLDIRGSFFASTSDRLAFKDGYVFSATNPEAPPLLTISAPLGLSSWLPASGTISNAAHLAVGQDLTLVGNQLDLQGQLQAGRNLSLVASDTLTARDSVTQPLMVAAGNHLLLQGTQSLDIAALNHPASRVVSGADMVLRSNNAAVGDARFSAGGNFQVERLDGSLGSVTSVQDPVFEVAGDFSLADYTGASLQILAGGSVMAGNITINGAGGSFNDSTVILSNGTSLVIPGTTQPTLDIRAGTTGFFGTPTSGGTPPARADITIGSITNSGGLVFITNQYQPNPTLAGDIQLGPISTSNEAGGGAVVIDSRGRLDVNSIDVSGSLSGVSGNGGNINLIAKGEIFIPVSTTLYSYGFTGGNISLASDTAITQESSSSIESSTWGPNQGGNVSLTAPSIALGGTVFNSTLFFDGGASGDIKITAQSLVTNQSEIQTQAWLANANSGKIVVRADSIALDATDLGSLHISTTGGKAGDVDIQSNSLTLTNGSQIGSRLASFFGNASGETGNVRVKAQTLSLSGYAPVSPLGEDRPTAIWTILRADTTGKAGDVAIESNSLTLTDGAQIGSIAYSGSTGDTGKVSVQSTSIALSGYAPADLTAGAFVPSAIRSTIQPGATGNSGSISVTTGTLSIQQGAAVGTSSFGIGNAGTVSVNASQSIAIDGAVFLPDSDNNTHPSNITSELGTGAVGNGGTVAIATPILQVTNGGTIAASTDGQGNAGDIKITATESASFDGVVSFANLGLKDRTSRAAVLAAENASGRAGVLTITTPVLSLTHGAQLNAETRGSGDAGTMAVNVSKSLFLTGANSGLIARTTPTATGNGGSIVISNPETVQILNGAQIAASTEGAGNGGSIDLKADSMTVQGAGSGIFASTSPTSTGNGGNIFIRNLGRVDIQNEAQVAVNSEGTGTAGDIVMQAGSLVLDNQGLISAETTSNTGGNITLKADDVLTLRHNSRISTSAGTVGAGGDGGNIAIATRYLVAIPAENSDITANAFTGRGGKIDITADGIFGFRVLTRSELEALLGTSDPSQLDPALLPTSDITAISQANPSLNGEVILRTPGIDPSQGVVNLPSTTVDASKLIARDCSVGGAITQSRGSLVVTGRGGLPPSPTGQLSAETILVGWETRDRSTESSQGAAAVSPQPPPPTQIVEVQALTLRSDGQVVLVAQSPEVAPPNFWNRSLSCSADSSEH